MEGTPAHLVLAGASIGAGGAFLWRTRGATVNGKLLVGTAVGGSLLWLGFVLWVVYSFAFTREGFN